MVQNLTSPVPAAPTPVPDDYKQAIAAYERQMLESALALHRFNQRACAKAIGLSYDQLRHAMRRNGLMDTG